MNYCIMQIGDGKRARFCVRRVSGNWSFPVAGLKVYRTAEAAKAAAMAIGIQEETLCIKTY